MHPVQGIVLLTVLATANLQPLTMLEILVYVVVGVFAGLGLYALVNGGDGC